MREAADFDIGKWTREKPRSAFLAAPLTVFLLVCVSMALDSGGEGFAAAVVGATCMAALTVVILYAVRLLTR